MEIKEFQKLLARLTDAALQNGKKIDYQVLRDFLQSAGLNQEQAGSVLQYLSSKGIRIEEAFSSRPNSTTTEIAKEDEFYIPTDDFPGTRIPMNYDDKEFLQNHLQSLENSKDSPEYLPLKIAAETAAEFNCTELLFPDLLQEASLAALGTATSTDGISSETIRKTIYKGICEAVRAQSATLDNDRNLVSKVEKLDQAIKDLTEEGENLPAFTASELAIILDKELEELKTILKLTGEDL